MNPKKLYYLNPNIKKSNIIESFTEEQVLEYARCSEDPIYFIEKYVKIQHVDHGLVDFILRGYQKKLIKSYVENRNNIVLSSRQSGKCFSINTMVRLRNKKTGEIIEKTIGELYNDEKHKE